MIDKNMLCTRVKPDTVALILNSIPEIARGAPALVSEKQALDSSCSTNNMVRLHPDVCA